MKLIVRYFALFVYYIIGYHLPNKLFPIIGWPSHKFRSFLCRHIFEATGSCINIERYVKFGKNKVTIGEGSGLGENFLLQNSELIVGDYVMIAPNVKVLGGHKCEKKDVPIGQQGAYPKTSLTIEDDVWIGNGVIILGKVKRVGKGAVIGAGSVVTKDVLECAVVAGNPAKVIKYRT